MREALLFFLISFDIYATEATSKIESYMNQGKEFAESLMEKNSQNEHSLATKEFLVGQLKGRGANSAIPDDVLSYLAKKKCQFDTPQINENVEQLFIFLSFSVPEEVWRSLSKEAEKFGGVIVLNGLPNNSFLELSRKIQVFNKLGVTSTVQINPQLFDKFGITVVPSFVVAHAHKYDKIAGNISLSYSLEQMIQAGETGIAAKFFKRGYL